MDLAIALALTVSSAPFTEAIAPALPVRTSCDAGEALPSGAIAEAYEILASGRDPAPAIAHARRSARTLADEVEVGLLAAAVTVAQGEEPWDDLDAAEAALDRWRRADRSSGGPEDAAARLALLTAEARAQRGMNTEAPLRAAEVQAREAMRLRPESDRARALVAHAILKRDGSGRRSEALALVDAALARRPCQALAAKIARKQGRR